MTAGGRAAVEAPPGRRPFDPALHLLLDPGALGRERTERLVRAAVAGGVTVVQMRQKDGEGSTRALVHEARHLVALTRALGAALIVNDRVDVAAAADADGVHVGQEDMAAADARRILGPRAIVGLSVWKEAQLAEAEPGVVDYVGAGPVFPTTGKPDAVAPIGVATLAAIRVLARVPVVAIGGIDAGNAGDAARAGCAGVAVITAIGAAADPEDAARRIRRALDDGRGGGR